MITDNEQKTLMTADDFQEEAATLRQDLLREAQRYLSGHNEAEDTVQDTMLRLWDMRDKLRSPMKPLAYVILRHLCVDTLRKRQPMVGMETIVLTDDHGDSHQAVERMMDAVTALPETQQTILRLRHMDGMDMESIAALTGMSEPAVRKALSRARMAVREKYINAYKNTTA